MSSDPLDTFSDDYPWRRYYDADGCLHRADGPAVDLIPGIDPDAVEHLDEGALEWWVHGVRHRVDGPAVMGIDALPVPSMSQIVIDRFVPAGQIDLILFDQRFHVELVIEPTSAYDGFEGTDEDGQPWAVPPTLGWGTDAGRAGVELTAALLEANGY